MGNSSQQLLFRSVLRYNCVCIVILLQWTAHS